MKIFARLLLAFMISFTLTELPIMKAQAGLIGTREALTDFNRSHGEASINDFISRADVKAKLVSFGVNPDDAQKRIASLSDREVKKLSDEITKASVGGDVVGILVIVLLVILVIYFAKRI